MLLAEGTYSASAVMLNPSGEVVTSVMNLPSFSIVPGGDATTGCDFPEGAFH